MKLITKRSILRWIHILFGIVPILGYVYSPFDQIPSYASLTRYGFVPVLLLSGYWMYAGLLFGIIGIALWLGAYQFSGYGAAVVSQIVLFIAWKIWTVSRSRKSNATSRA
jgi:hypothetical protein